MSIENELVIDYLLGKNCLINLSISNDRHENQLSSAQKHSKVSISSMTRKLLLNTIPNRVCEIQKTLQVD